MFRHFELGSRAVGSARVIVLAAGIFAAAPQPGAGQSKGGHPRARAVFALKLFEDAASKLGWVVMSSYNSLSDSLPEPNEKALEAMLRSAQERLSIDRSRLYLAGFSGTARAVLRFAVTLRGHVAGVIAVGGALGFELGGPESVFAGDSTFAYFGAAGIRDFN